MSPTRIEPQIEPLDLDLTAAFSLEHGLGRAELLQFGPQLDAARQHLIDAASGDSAVCLMRPKQLLDDYQKNRHRSTLGQILSAAKQLRDLVDRAVILAPPSMIAAAQVLFAACCHPHHNDLSRGQRGGRPRIFFAPARSDNDALQGLFDILPHERLLHTVDERWGVVVVGDHDCNMLAALFGIFWEALQSTVESHAETQFAIAIGAADSPLMQFAEQTGCQQIIADTPEVAMCASFHPGVLLAASVMGMDIVKLLRGAALMAERFVTAPPGDNPVLDLAGLRHLLAKRRNIMNCVIDSADAALQPLAQHMGATDRSAQHLLIELAPQGLRRDRLRVTMRSESAATPGTKRSDRYLNDLAAEQFESALKSRSAAGQPTAVVHLPNFDESTVGQLTQLFSITDIFRRKFLTPDN